MYVLCVCTLVGKHTGFLHSGSSSMPPGCMFVHEKDIVDETEEPWVVLVFT